MTYNIFWGGGDHDPVCGRQHDGCVIESRSDIVVFQEANGWSPSEQNLIAAYADSLSQHFPQNPRRGFVAHATTGFHACSRDSPWSRSCHTGRSVDDSG
jgi:hypothetical protein